MQLVLHNLYIKLAAHTFISGAISAFCIQQPVQQVSEVNRGIESPAEEREGKVCAHLDVGGAVIGAALGAVAEGPHVAAALVPARAAAVGCGEHRLCRGVAVHIHHQRVSTHILLHRP